MYELTAGDVLIVDDKARMITKGKVTCYADSGSYDATAAQFDDVIMDEAYAAHDDGNMVFEVADGFIGLWRPT